ncbi:MAG: cell envelope integrity protein CreD [Pseudomonadota bacterium]
MSDVANPPPSRPSAPRPARPVFQGAGWRFFGLILITVLMGVPLLMVAFVIEDRVSYKRQAVSEVSSQWGGAVHLEGPALVIPVLIERDRVIEERDGSERIETYTEQAAPILLMPEELEITAASASEVRRRGIFEVPVYSVDLAARFGFDVARVARVIGERETVQWDRAFVSVAMPSVRSFSGAAVLETAGRAFDLEPGSVLGHGGVEARVGDPRGLGAFNLSMRLNGAQRLTFTPTGRLTRVALTSDWADPSFDGAFLPTTRSVTPDGFEATWEIPHLAREIPQVSRGTGIREVAFGVSFFNSVDIYHRVQRAAKYGVLFIALTFLTVFLTERLSKRPAHPAQVVLIGISQCVFFLLLLSLAEQIGFAAAYVGAAGATIALITFYGATGLGLGRWWWTLAAPLVVLYAVLNLILRSSDYALLAGSLLAFVAVALMMILTRRDDWSGGRSGPHPEPA